MSRTIAAIALGAAIALSPVSLVAVRSQTAAPAATHHARPHHVAPHKPTGSFQSEMRKRSNQSRERARAGAEHVRKMQGQ
jgi:hypothetical protein